MRIEPKQAFYNEETGAVQPWKDIEVTDSVGNALVAEGLVTEIEGGGGGGGDFGSAKVTFEIGSGVGSLIYSSSVDYPPFNPNSSNQFQYNVTQVIGNTKGPYPVTEIDSTQEEVVVMYQGTAYLDTIFTLQSYDSGNVITVSGYTLSGAAETVEDAEDPFYGMIKVTGDCTVTLTRE